MPVRFDDTSCEKPGKTANDASTRPPAQPNHAQAVPLRPSLRKRDTVTEYAMQTLSRPTALLLGDGTHVFEDPVIAEYYRQVYEKSK